MPVRYVPVKSYPAAVTSFVNGDVQLAWFGGVTGVQARAKVPGSQAIAQGAEDTAFRSYMIANAATGLKEAPEIQKAIAGHTFTFGARTSTSGRVMPEYLHPPGLRRRRRPSRSSPASASRATIPARSSSCSPAPTTSAWSTIRCGTSTARPGRSTSPRCR